MFSTTRNSQDMVTNPRKLRAKQDTNPTATIPLPKQEALGAKTTAEDVHNILQSPSSPRANGLRDMTDELHTA